MLLPPLVQEGLRTAIQSMAVVAYSATLCLGSCQLIACCYHRERFKQCVTFAEQSSQVTGDLTSAEREAVALVYCSVGTSRAFDVDGTVQGFWDRGISW